MVCFGLIFNIDILIYYYGLFFTCHDESDTGVGVGDTASDTDSFGDNNIDGNASDNVDNASDGGD